jgi:hypothetical protein
MVQGQKMSGTNKNDILYNIHSEFSIVVVVVVNYYVRNSQCPATINMKTTCSCGSCAYHRTHPWLHRAGRERFLFLYLLLGRTLCLLRFVSSICGWLTRTAHGHQSYKNNRTFHLTSPHGPNKPRPISQCCLYFVLWFV